MRRRKIRSSALIAVMLTSASSLVIAADDRSAGQPDPFQWKVSTPQREGMSSAGLNDLTEQIAKRRTAAFLVIRNDKVVHEWYAPGTDRHKPLGTASLAKAIVGGMSLSVALTDGRLSLDTPVRQLVPQWRADSAKSRITIRHLGSHTSGLADASIQGTDHADLPSWMGAFWKKLPPPDDPFTLARDKAPILFPAGERIRYSNPAIGMLTYCVSAAYRDLPQRDIRLLLRDRVMRPIGISDGEWSAGYGQVFQVDGLPLVGAWGGGNYSIDAVARIGRLVLREGDWDGKKVLSAEAVREVTTDAGLPGHCGMGWWTNGGNRYPELPGDAVWGAGAGDKVLLVIPSLDLIMVRSGQALHTPEEIAALKPKDVFEEFHDPRERVLFRRLMQTVIDRPPVKEQP